LSLTRSLNTDHGPVWLKRLGYSGFLSAVWMLWKMNRNAKQLRITTKAEIILPVPGLK
jgi:hypothetical protein